MISDWYWGFIFILKSEEWEIEFEGMELNKEERRKKLDLVFVKMRVERVVYEEVCSRRVGGLGKVLF